jgi:hypothetical protein
MERPYSPQVKTTTLPKHPGTYVKLTAETNIAVSDALDWIRARSKGLLCSNQRSRSRHLNNLIRQMCDAIVRCEDNSVRGSGIPWPIAFDARRETREEQFMRESLDSLTRGQGLLEFEEYE